MAVANGCPQIELRGPESRGRILGAILALNGARRADVKSSSTLAARLADRTMLVAVDGGLRACRRRPDLFVGDQDSSSHLPEGIPSVLYPADKNFSDLAGALREVRKRRARVVIVAGLVGGRLDHEWSNLFELGNWSRHFDAILAPTIRGTVIVTSRGCRAVTARRRLFSLFSLGPTSTVTLLGAEYELHRRRLRPGSLGLSNRTGTELDLRVHSGTVALVIPPAAGR
jgi:thiamine pyrophosphokinase